MSERDFSVGGKEFKLSKVDAFKQFHIARRMGPILADIVPALAATTKAVKDPQKVSEEEQFKLIGALAGPIMDGLSKLSDKDSEFVLLGLLSAVEMKQPMGNWAFVARGDLMMIQDLELPMMLQLAGRSFVYNLSGFFAALPRS